MSEKDVLLTPGEDEMLYQAELPIIDIEATKETTEAVLTDKFTAPGGHAQWGVMLLFDALNFNLPENNKTYIRAF